MKKQLWQIVGLVAALVATSPAIGQSNRGDTITNIPFAFKVAHQALPPGRYTITRIGEITRIFDSRNHSEFVYTFKVDGRAAEGLGKLVFHRYGNVYFLSEVWLADDASGRKVFPTLAEKEFAGKGMPAQIAVLRIAP